jgi:GAF domain-containing protein
VIQQAEREGPGLATIADHHTCLVDDLFIEDRWSRFSHRAATETGVRSMLTLRLFTLDDTLGVLNLYSRNAKAFDTVAVDVATVLAAHAAVAMTAAQVQQRAENLDVALHTNRRIGIALGITMTRHGLDHDAAFARLLQASQNANTKLRDLAETIIDTGDIPPAES